MPLEPTYVAHLCFDECLPRKWCMRLAEMLHLRKMPVEAFNLVDRYGSGQKDDAVADWLANHKPRLLVISGDTGAQSKRDDPRLPRILPERQVTGVFLNPKICQKDGFEKVRLVMVCLPSILRAYDGPIGARYRIRDTGGHYSMEDWPTVTSTAPNPALAAPSARQPPVRPEKASLPSSSPPV